jgi:GT2 family glycosyltransferase
MVLLDTRSVGVNEFPTAVCVKLLQSFQLLYSAQKCASSLENGLSASKPDRIAILIVGFRNPGDVGSCLAALANANKSPSFDIFICENGGALAFDALIDELAAGQCSITAQDVLTLPFSRSTAENGFVRLKVLRLRNTSALVTVGDAPQNLGYAGGVNAWLRPILEQHNYAGLWILNPDTQPEPEALAELVAYAHSRCKGMVGSRIVSALEPDHIHSRGLRWKPAWASTEALDYHAPTSVVPDPDEVEARLDAPSGASVYVTRDCIEKIGLMDERYFLYFEDLEWGLRAKQQCGVGYAWRSVVPHRGGTTIGTAGTRAGRSPLSVYLEFRNRILFVGQRYPAWFVWTVLVLLVRALEYGLAGSWTNMRMAYRGVAAGLAGEIGRPDQWLSVHRQ